MPNYQTHDTICYLAAPIITAASLIYLEPKQSLLFGAAILVTNHYLSPDTDTRSIIDHRWGWLSFIWYLYRKLFHHRSFFTHSGIISATIRLCYLAIWLLPLLFIIPWYDVTYFIHNHTQELFIVYIAACVSDALHTGVDFIVHITKVSFSFWKNTYRFTHRP